MELTPEHKAKLAEGRRRAAERKQQEEAEQQEPKPVTVAQHALQELAASQALDIVDPIKWQMKIRIYLETLNADEADVWMEGVRLVATMASRYIRDQVYKRVTAFCYVCTKRFKEGRPAGEAGYYDADNHYIKVYCCDQSEYGRLLEKAKQKTDQIAQAKEAAEDAGRKALIAARQAFPRESDRIDTKEA